MANLPETPDYPAGVYQLETSDPVLGGPGGISNRQAEQLANRTAWLKAKVDAFIDGTVAVLKATKLATARTLSISGAGSGSTPFDGSANANIVLTLADSGAVAGTYPKVTVNAKGIVTGGAVLAAGDIPVDLALTGNPTAPTPPQFDNDQSLINSAFMQRALGNHAASTVVNAATVLTAASAGKITRFGNGGYTVTLPLLADVGDAATFWLKNTGTGVVTIAGNGAEKISTTGNQLASIDLGIGDDVLLSKSAAGAQWTAFSGSAVLQYAAAMAGANWTTPPQFDASKKLATMEAVQRAMGGGFRGNLALSGTPLTLTPDQIGYRINATTTVLNLPQASSVPIGATFNVSFSGGACTLNAFAGDTIASGNALTGAASAVFNHASFAKIVKITATTWLVLGTAALKYENQFAASLGASGYQLQPSGKIKQWGVTAAIPGGSSLIVTLPTAAPVAIECVNATFANEGADLAAGDYRVAQVRARTLTSFTLRNLSSSASQYFWEVICR